MHMEQLGDLSYSEELSARESLPDIVFYHSFRQGMTYLYSPILTYFLSPCSQIKAEDQVEDVTAWA